MKNLEDLKNINYPTGNLLSKIVEDIEHREATESNSFEEDLYNAGFNDALGVALDIIYVRVKEVSQ